MEFPKSHKGTVMENIILIGHGSPKKDANNVEMVGRLLHQAIHPGCSKGCVKVAYLQFAEPDLMDTIKESVHGGAGRVIVHPFFLSSGMHVTKDIPEMIEDAKAMYPEVEFVYTEPLGIHEKLVQVIAERIKTAGALLPADIEKKSFEIISEEIDLSDVPQEQVPIIKRVIHTTADFEFKRILIFHPDAINTGINAIRAGKNILTDVEMVKTGINKKLLKKWGGEVICNIQQSAFSHQQSEVKTKAAMGIESALKENNNIGIIAIGNAPTALLKAIEIFTPPTPPLNKGGNTGGVPLVIGVPVGFVKALESKALLSAQNFPFITNLSRKGGSPVAAAIVNALLKMAC